jgi:hypothetical protein
MTAAFDTLYAAMFARPLKPGRAAVWTITPKPCFSIWGSTAWLTMKQYGR